MKRILTGDRPTGPLHIGHYFGALKNRVALQKEYDTYILIADVQALTDNFNNPEKVKNNVLEVVLDNLAVGIDPQYSKIVIQSKIPAIAELTIFFSNLVSIARLSRNPTVKEEIKQKKEIFGNAVTYGFFGYPISQAADILAFNAHLVPVGEDQAPMIELTREIARHFNSIYGEVFVEPDMLVPEKNSRIKGLDGNTKMGKSLNNAIYIKDAPEEISAKVMKAYTDPKKIKKNDPGHPEGCMVYYYHQLFSESQVQTVYHECTMGLRGCVQCKKQLIENIISYLEPFRLRRLEYQNKIDTVIDIIKTSTKIAYDFTETILQKVKELMKIDYYNIFG